MELFLLGTTGCHLCEDAETIITTVVSVVTTKINIESIDIAEHEQWQEKYAIRIPVLYHPETKTELGWPFSQVQVEMFIQELNND